MSTHICSHNFANNVRNQNPDISDIIVVWMFLEGTVLICSNVSRVIALNNARIKIPNISDINRVNVLIRYIFHLK